MMFILISLAAATLISEDAASVVAGALVAQHTISVFAGILACALGIYVGDLLLFAVGRFFGERALGWHRVARVLTPDRRRDLRDAGHRHLSALVFGSRFLPGTRLPLYLAAGALGCSTRAFAWWSGLAVAVWTPAIVLGSSHVVRPTYLPESSLARFAVAVSLVVAGRAALRFLAARRVRVRTIALISRLWRWEFWPMWLFYLPVAAWIVVLIAKHRGVGVIAAANPGIPDGGIVGESKHDILQRLPPEWTIPSIRIDAAPLDLRVWRFAQTLSHMRWPFPVVFKPDVGQRGSGVKLVRSLDDAREYFLCENNDVVVQPYHPGPYEAGVFYYRMPEWTIGRILSITDKHFPDVVGDGHSTIEELIWADRRLRMQARTFFSRHRAQLRRVPASGERVPLAIAGNHCQGTLFRDGSHLITPALEERIDAIARVYRGFFIGRFDVRYSDVERFKAGEDLAIVELNGTTAESTNIYDPERSLFAAYRQLFRQWSLVFAIGAANRAAGTPATSLGRLLQLLRGHLGARQVFETSD